MALCTLIPAVIGVAGQVIKGIQGIEDAEQLEKQLEALKERTEALKKSYNDLKVEFQKKHDELEVWRDLLTEIDAAEDNVDSMLTTAVHTRLIMLDLSNDQLRNAANNSGKTQIRAEIAKLQQRVAQASSLTLASLRDNRAQVQAHLNTLGDNLHKLAGSIGILPWEQLISNDAPGAPGGNVTIGDLKGSIGAIQGLASNAYRPNILALNG